MRQLQRPGRLRTATLALLTPTSKFVKSSLSITTESKFTMGAQVSTWGYPEGYTGSLALLSVGHLAGVGEQRSPGGNVVRRWVVNGAFNRGTIFLDNRW